MIPKPYIAAWRAHAPWSSDAYVEQDLILSRAAIEIFSDSFFSRAPRFSRRNGAAEIVFEGTGPLLGGYRSRSAARGADRTGDERHPG